jgi:cell division septation protein DedD
MRGSIAEDRGNKNNGRAETTIRSGMGYKLKPSEDSGRSAMGTRRGENQGWELRLGKLQVVVWLGLALGSICGAYCIGFFSGRYVGFETGREVTGVEVAKLPVGDVMQESSSQSQDRIYDRLNSPAVMADDSNGKAKDKAAVRAPSSNQKVPRLLEDNVAQAAVVGSKEPNSRDGAQGATDATQDDLANFWDDSTGGSELIIGSESGLGAGKPSENVRMLGGSKAAESAKTDPKSIVASVEAPKDTSVNALLDERIAKARGENAKDTSSLDGAAQAADTSKNGDTASVARKVVPSGYFAQIAAPKTLAEAEGVAKKLKRSGFPVVVEPTSVAGQSFYRVLVGPEQNKVQADRLVSQLKSESYISGTPFIRKVK